MKRNRLQHHISDLMALITFCVFAICVMTVLMTGINAYSRLTERNRLSYDRRTCMQYMAMRVHSSDTSDRITIGNFDGSDALILHEDGYFTFIYCSDGYLKELYCAENYEANPGDGERILKAEHMDLSLDNGLLSITLTAGGSTNTLHLSLRSGERADTL